LHAGNDNDYGVAFDGRFIERLWLSTFKCPDPRRLKLILHRAFSTEDPMESIYRRSQGEYESDEIKKLLYKGWLETRACRRLLADGLYCSAVKLWFENCQPIVLSDLKEVDEIERLIEKTTKRLEAGDEELETIASNAGGFIPYVLSEIPRTISEYYFRPNAEEVMAKLDQYHVERESDNDVGGDEEILDELPDNQEADLDKEIKDELGPREFYPDEEEDSWTQNENNGDDVPF